MSELSVNELTKNLVSKESITPFDAECQPEINEILASCGFKVLDFSLKTETAMGEHTITNTFAYIEGAGALDRPSVVFAGHTDIADVKDQVDNWKSEPFQLTEKNGMLIGRGTADMKGGLAPMVTAAHKFVSENPNFSGKIGFALTSFEEIADDPDLDVNTLGTNYIVQRLLDMGYPVDFVIVGEPTSQDKLGDTIKNGRRGSGSVELEVAGDGGHTAVVSPQTNPLMIASYIMKNFMKYPWQPSNGNFPPSNLNFNKIEGASTMANVPGKVKIAGSVRFGKPYTGKSISDEIVLAINNNMQDIINGIDPALKDKVSYKPPKIIIDGEPYLTPPESPLILMSQIAVSETLGTSYPELSTGGGSSDGRYLASLKNSVGQPAQVIEIGHVGKTIHKPNESIPIGDLEKLESVHLNLLNRIFQK